MGLLFEHLLGHDRIKKTLQTVIETGVFQQAYLLSGPNAVGKMTLIKEFFAGLRTGKSFDPQSPMGKQFLSSQGKNLICFFDQGESLKIDDVKKIADFVRFSTAETEVSIIVIEHLERLTLSAANALLKVLEEPPARVMFLMTTTAERKLLPTIRSRVQASRLLPPPEHLVISYLQGQGVDALLQEELVSLSAGKIGFAVRLIHDQVFFEHSRKLWDLALLIPEKDIVDRFALADHLTQEEYTSADLQQFFMYLAWQLRAAGTGKHLTQLARLSQVKRLFDDTQVNKRLHLEALLLSM